MTSIPTSFAVRFLSSVAATRYPIGTELYRKPSNANSFVAAGSSPLPSSLSRPVTNLFSDSLSTELSATTTPFSKDNPMLDFTGLPRFDVIAAEHALPAMTEAVASAKTRLAELESKLKQIASPTWNDIYPEWSALRQPIVKLSAIISQLSSTLQSEKWVEASQVTGALETEFSLIYAQNETIYKTFESIRNSAEWYQLDDAQRQIVEDAILKAKLYGLSLEGSERVRFQEISTELDKLQKQFSSNITNSGKSFQVEITDKSELEGLLDSDLAFFAEAYVKAFKTKNPDSAIVADVQNGPWLITKNGTERVFLRGANRGLREKLFRLLKLEASSGDVNNTLLIPRILALRQEKAQLLKIGTFADLSLASKMAETVANADELLLMLHEKSIAKTLEETLALAEFAKSKGLIGELELWDRGYYAEKMQAELFDVDDALVKKYITLPKAMQAVNEAVATLFGVTIVNADEETSTYHPDVRYYKVLDEFGEQIASFYFDPYKRSGSKRDGAWMNEFVPRMEREDGSVQLPVGLVTTNSDEPQGDLPAQLSLRELNTLFHEFGHLFQQMLTEVKYPEMSGTNGIKWDAVEIASQLLQEWPFQKSVLKSLAQHVETGEPMPDGLIDKVLASRQFMIAAQTSRQVALAMTDLELHHRYDVTSSLESPQDVYKRIYTKATGLKPLEQDYFLNVFNHLFGGDEYAAGYFSYKWAEVLAADYLSALEPFFGNPEALRIVGERLRKTLYAQGGSRHPSLVFRDMMGRDYSVDALLRQSGLLD